MYSLYIPAVTSGFVAYTVPVTAYGVRLSRIATPGNTCRLNVVRLRVNGYNIPGYVELVAGGNVWMFPRDVVSRQAAGTSLQIEVSTWRHYAPETAQPQPAFLEFCEHPFGADFGREELDQDIELRVYLQTSNLACPVNTPGAWTDKDVPGLSACGCRAAKSAMLDVRCADTAAAGRSGIVLSVTEHAFVGLVGTVEHLSAPLPLAVVPHRGVQEVKRCRFHFPLSGKADFLKVRAWRLDDAVAETLSGASLTVSRLPLSALELHRRDDYQVEAGQQTTLSVLSLPVLDPKTPHLSLAVRNAAGSTNPATATVRGLVALNPAIGQNRHVELYNFAVVAAVGATELRHYAGRCDLWEVSIAPGAATAEVTLAGWLDGQEA